MVYWVSGTDALLSVLSWIFLLLELITNHHRADDGNAAIPLLPHADSGGGSARTRRIIYCIIDFIFIGLIVGMCLWCASKQPTKQYLYPTAEDWGHITCLPPDTEYGKNPILNEPSQLYHNLANIVGFLCIIRSQWALIFRHQH
ncbi:unnamed protein product [Didymodactylos carnosus]|nr:unnamed protein product [Didymodactylos carnosus]CAF4395776.1 unnamed protein product [Didymodactylos carnosus]